MTVWLQSDEGRMEPAGPRHGVWLDEGNDRSLGLEVVAGASGRGVPVFSNRNISRRRGGVSSGRGGKLYGPG